MVAGVRRRLALLYAAIFAATLLLLGPVLYLSFAHQLAEASDVTLRLAAQREAARAFTPAGVTLGINNRFAAPRALALRDVFYVLLTPQGQVQANPQSVLHPGLPDRQAALQAAHEKSGVFSTLPTRDVGDIRLFTVPIMRGTHVVALLQAGHSLSTLAAARRSLLFFLLGLGAAAVGTATVGGLLLTRQAMRPINAAFAAQRAFVADASHELRTPLTLIRTNAEVLLEAGAVSAAEDRALMEDIVGETEHMGRLIADLLMLARLDAGVLPLERAPVTLAALATTCCRQMARLAERHDVHLVNGAVAPLVVLGDAARLEQVLLILLDNAIKYNRPGGTVEVTLRGAGQQAMLAVCDTGRGIAATELPHLCARFHRGQDAGTVAEGYGLGLAIAEGIVRAHRGRLLVRSEEGVGSTFTVLLPLSSRGDTRPAMSPAVGVR
jgi:signal transduction histidine kinase